MHKMIVLALLTVATVGVLDSVALATPEYPFCIKGCDFGSGPGDCSFVNYQQCQATLSGRTGYCDTNPSFRSGNALKPTRYKLSRRRL